MAERFEIGEHVEVVNPTPTGARGVVLQDPGTGHVLVRWTDHGYGQVGQTGWPQARLLRRCAASPRTDQTNTEAPDAR